MEILLLAFAPAPEQVDPRRSECVARSSEQQPVIGIGPLLEVDEELKRVTGVRHVFEGGPALAADRGFRPEKGTDKPGDTGNR